MTEQPSLEYLEEHLGRITSSFSSEDWKTNREILSRIRNLTVEPRNVPAVRPARDIAKDDATSLDQLLELPDDGRSSLEQVEPILDLFEDERRLTEYCGSEGLQPKATAVAKAVFRSLDRPESIYADIWHGTSNFYGSKGTTACRLLETDNSIESEGDVNGARYRVNALLFAFHYRARCDELVATKQRETVVLQKIMEESGKTIHQIKNLLKRGRWYALWVNKLGLGAILMLGGSLASSNQMHDIHSLIKVCKAMPDFCERSRKLSGFARKAIVEAIIQSGQTAPVTAQRYIDYSGTAEISSNDRAENTTSLVADCQATNERPSLREVHERLMEGFHAPVPFPMADPTAVRQQMQSMSSQWQENVELSGQAAQQASFRPSPDANNPIQMTLTDAGEVLPRPVAANYLGTSQGYGNVGADGTAWDDRNLGTSYQGEDVDLSTWNFTFPMPSFVLQ